MKGTSLILYRVCRWLLRAALGFYFTRITRFHSERVPASGPLLFTCNHPNSLTDAFVVGASVPRKVNFVATVQLFRIRPIRWFLTQCGVIAINRVKDDPRAMRSVKNTFEACFNVLEKGEAVAIFPEGITHDDPQLKTVKTGAARMALELEDRYQGKLGLTIVPVGLTFAEKDRYRSTVLVNFGEPIAVADFWRGYTENRHACIQRLNGEIERRIQSLMVHLPHLERARIVEAVKRLYLDRLWVANTVIHEPVPAQAGELLLTQRIGEAVDQTFERHPDRAADFVRRLTHYETALRRMQLPEEVLVQFSEAGPEDRGLKNPRNAQTSMSALPEISAARRTSGCRGNPALRWILWKSLCWGGVAIVGLPVALYGWAHRLLPHLLLQWIVGKAVKTPADRTHVSTASIIGGLVLFTLFYGFCVLVVHQFVGWRATALYACSLPVASLIGLYYVRGLRRFAVSFRAALVLLRAPVAAEKLLRWRAALIQLIETEREEFLAAQETRTQKGA